MNELIINQYHADMTYQEKLTKRIFTYLDGLFDRDRQAFERYHLDNSNVMVATYVAETAIDGMKLDESDEGLAFDVAAEWVERMTRAYGYNE